jgi:uncharacterized protein
MVSAPMDLEAAKRAYEQGNYATALKELKPLVEQGNAEAQALLGMMYNLGRGVPMDIGQAEKLYKAAADQGNAEGECHLGAMYLIRDTAQGLKLLHLSAEQGFSDAYLMLGLAYKNLKEAPRDFVQADMWLRLAAAHSDPLGPGQLAKLESQMSKEQIARGRAMAESWKPKSASRPVEVK